MYCGYKARAIDIGGGGGEVEKGLLEIFIAE